MAETLVLVVTDGAEDPRDGSRLACPASGATLGRSPDNTHCLPDTRVSRRHARIARLSGLWTITDTGSVAGTTVNGVRIEPNTPTPISPSDALRIGPWTMRVEGDARRRDTTLATLSADGTHATVHTPSRRLETLSACIESLSRTSGETELARAALVSAMQGVGARRGAVLRPPSDEGGAPVVVSIERRADTWAEISSERLRVPRSLVTTAMTDRTAVIDSGTAPVDVAVSIVEQQIQSAVCVPVKLDDRVVALLYVDAREGEAPIRDGASFVEDVAQVYSLALSYDARREMDRRQAALRADIERAGLLRDMLAPPESIEIHDYRAVHAMRAGALVSGDLVDVIALPEQRVGVLFGDASGHGVGAAMLTALAQSYLHSELQHHDHITDAVEHANRFIASRETRGSFVSLWAATLDANGLVEHVDAGHGHWCVVRASGEIEVPDIPSGPPLGVLEEVAYPHFALRMAVGDRVVLYTDGVSEREDDAGTQAGAQGVHDALSGSASCEEDVMRVLALLDSHPMGAHDDATVMSIQRSS